MVSTAWLVSGAGGMGKTLFPDGARSVMTEADIGWSPPTPTPRTMRHIASQMSEPDGERSPTEIVQVSRKLERYG